MKSVDHYKVSVVIPTPGRDTVKLVVESLEKQSRKPDEILVIQDEKFYGASWPRNQGINKAKGDLIAFADDDCIYPKDWLERLIRALDKYDAAGAGGTYIDTDLLLQDLRNRRGFPKEEGLDVGGFSGVGGNMLYRRAYLDKVKKRDGYYYDEKLCTGEDSDLSSRVVYAGGKLAFVPSNATHLKRVNFKKFMKMQYYRGMGIGQLHMKAKREKRDLVRRGLLRKDSGSPLKRLLLIIWRKGLGPFDVKNFSSFRNYIYAWFGQKAELLGFAKEMIRMKLRGKKK